MTWWAVVLIWISFTDPLSYLNFFGWPNWKIGSNLLTQAAQAKHWGSYWDYILNDNGVEISEINEDLENNILSYMEYVAYDVYSGGWDKKEN